jgi:hypothetical protein
VAGSCEYCDESLGSGAMELASVYSENWYSQISVNSCCTHCRFNLSLYEVRLCTDGIVIHNKS